MTNLSLAMDFEQFCQQRVRRRIAECIDEYGDENLTTAELKANTQKVFDEIERLSELFYETLKRQSELEQP